MDMTTPMQPKPLVNATCKLGDKGCFNDGRCHALGDCENKIVTNADRIRAMSDEELATLLLEGCRGSTCYDQPENEWGSVDCFQCRMDWLKKPYKEEAYDQT